MPICGYCKEYRGAASAVLRHIEDGCSTDPRWREVVEARAEGDEARASRVTRRILGVVVEMSEEAKAKLREYAEAHKEELAEKRRLRAAVRRRQRELMRPRGRR